MGQHVVGKPVTTLSTLEVEKTKSLKHPKNNTISSLVTLYREAMG